MKRNRPSPRHFFICPALVLAVAFSPAPAISQQPPTASATLTGRLILDGEPPTPEVLSVGTRRYNKLNTKSWDDRDAIEFNHLKLLDQSLIVGKDRGVKNIVIWLHRDDVAPVTRADQTEKPILRLAGGKVEPRVLAVHAPQAVVLENQESYVTNFRYQHFNVLVLSKKSVEVEVKPSRFKHPPVPAKLESN